MNRPSLPPRASTILAMILFAVLLVPAAAQPSRPNVILIVADDLGAHDLGVTGSRFHETPNLDRIAREGMLFTQAYSACTVCSPTRAALLTGKYPARLKITDWIAGHDAPKAKLRPPADWAKQLPLAEITLAERARAAGLATLHIGKWHLGGDGFGPTEQGFDNNLGGDHRGQPPSYFAPYGLPKLPDGPAGEYLTDREGAEAARFITGSKERPFFLYLAFHSVHTPLQAKARLIEKYQAKALNTPGGQTNAVYAAMLESLDEAVGTVLRAVDEAGLADRTAIIFTSDNGGLVLGKNPPTSNQPLRSGKGSQYEGGVRVPLIVKWPGRTQAGARSGEPVISMDIAATLAEALHTPGGTNPSTMDGRSLMPVFRDPAATLGRTHLCWHYPHYHPGGATPYAAIRAGDWKLIQYYENGRHELFNLREDPGEATDLSGAMPGKVTELARKLFEWQGSVGAQWPMFNPAHESKPVAQDAAGSVILHARDAAIHGTTLRYEPQPFKNTLGWWGRTEDWVEWRLTVHQPGTFDVELLQGCGKGHGGSDVRVEVGGTSLMHRVLDTGHFQHFVPRVVGRVALPAGSHTLALKPQRKQAGAVMDIRQVTLTPSPGTPGVAPAGETFLKARRVVFVGDSITYAGGWVALAEAYVRIAHPKAPVEFINVGLPSETLSGLSEPGHAGGAFPRPDLHERLGRLLDQLKPDVLVACYGMNDGVYHPLGEDRFRKFQEGMQRLRDRASAAGATVIHVTPPVFDATRAGRTLPAGLAEYRSPYVGYNEVLDRYSEWLVGRRTNGWEVIDTHTPMNQFLAEQRKTDPKFFLAGDGVHAGDTGHWLIAREFLRFLGVDPRITDSPDGRDAMARLHPHGAEILGLVTQRQAVLRDAWLNKVGHLRPGMGKGKPLAAAEAEAAELAGRIRTLGAGR